MPAHSPTIRQAGHGDAERLAALITRFFGEEGFPAEPERIRAAAAPFLAQPTNAAFLAMADGEAVGVATITTTFGFEVGRYAELEDLYVLPDRRRQGIAASLLDAAAEWCRRCGCRALEVVVTPEGESRHGLTGWYLRRGFDDRGRRLLSRDL